MAKMTALQAAANDICAGVEALIAAVEELGSAPAPPADDEEETPPTPPKSRKKAAKKKAANAKAEAAAPKEKGPTVADVRTALKGVVEIYGREGASEILEGFKVEMISDLDADQYPDVLAACTEYLEDE